MLEQRRKELLKKKEEERLRKLVEQRRREWHQLKEREKNEAQKNKQRQLVQRKKAQQQKALLDKQRLIKQRQLQQQKQAVSKAKPQTQPAAKTAAAPKVITNPEYQRREKIKYPRNARRKKLQGTVIMRASVTVTGQVQKAWVYKSSGHSALDKAAMKSVPRWVFKAAKRDGVAVTSTVQFPVVFRLK